MDTQKEILLLKEQNKYLAEELLSLINSFNQHAVLAEKQRIHLLTFQEKVFRKIDLKEEDFPELDEYFSSLSTKDKLLDTCISANENFIKNWNDILDES